MGAKIARVSPRGPKGEGTGLASRSSSRQRIKARGRCVVLHFSCLFHVEHREWGEKGRRSLSAQLYALTHAADHPHDQRCTRFRYNTMQRTPVCHSPTYPSPHEGFCRVDVLELSCLLFLPSSSFYHLHRHWKPTFQDASTFSASLPSCPEYPLPSRLTTSSDLLAAGGVPACDRRLGLHVPGKELCSVKAQAKTSEEKTALSKPCHPKLLEHPSPPKTTRGVEGCPGHEATPAGRRVRPLVVVPLLRYHHRRRGKQPGQNHQQQRWPGLRRQEKYTLYNESTTR